MVSQEELIDVLPYIRYRGFPYILFSTPLQIVKALDNPERTAPVTRHTPACYSCVISANSTRLLIWPAMAQPLPILNVCR